MCTNCVQICTSETVLKETTRLNPTSHKVQFLVNRELGVLKKIHNWAGILETM